MGDKTAIPIAQFDGHNSEIAFIEVGIDDEDGFVITIPFDNGNAREYIPLHPAEARSLAGALTDFAGRIENEDLRSQSNGGSALTKEQ